jgi:hypothetical protein
MTKKDEKSITYKEKISSSVLKMDDKILSIPKFSDGFLTTCRSLPGLQASINNMSKTVSQNMNFYQRTGVKIDSTNTKIDPKDILKISKKHKKILLFDFFDINQKEVINDFFRSTTGKNLVNISNDKSEEVVQKSIYHLPLITELPKNVISIDVHFCYSFGHHFSLMFECDLNVDDLYETFSEDDCESLIKSFQLFEDLQVQIEETLPEQFNGLFLKNELNFIKPKLKLPYIYIYDIHDYKYIFEINYNENIIAPIYRLTLKRKVDLFANVSTDTKDN